MIAAEESRNKLTVFAQRTEVLCTTVAQEPGEDRKTRAAVQTRRVTARSTSIGNHLLAETRRQVARLFIEYYPLDDAAEWFDRLSVQQNVGTEKYTTNGCLPYTVHRNRTPTHIIYTISGADSEGGAIGVRASPVV